MFYLVKSEGLGDSESPALLESSPNHGSARGGRGAGQTKGVFELNAADFHREVYVVDRAVELGQFYGSVEWDALRMFPGKGTENFVLILSPLSVLLIKCAIHFYR